MNHLEIYNKFPTWDDLVVIIDNNSVLYFHLDEIFNIGKRVVIVEFTDGLRYWCEMDYTSETPGVGTDQEDYDNNYKDKAGTKDYLRNSWKFTAIKNVTTIYDSIKLQNPSDIDVETFLFKGYIKTNDKAVFGDYFAIEAVDKDGLYYPAGTILKTFVKREYLVAGQQTILINPPNQDSLGIKKKLFSGIFLYIHFTSTGTTDVEVIVSAEFKY